MIKGVEQYVHIASEQPRGKYVVHGNLYPEEKTVKLQQSPKISTDKLRDQELYNQMKNSINEANPTRDLNKVTFRRIQSAKMIYERDSQKFNKIENRSNLIDYRGNLSYYNQTKGVNSHLNKSLENVSMRRGLDDNSIVKDNLVNKSCVINNNNNANNKFAYSKNIEPNQSQNNFRKLDINKIVNDNRNTTSIENENKIFSQNNNRDFSYFNTNNMLCPNKNNNNNSVKKPRCQSAMPISRQPSNEIVKLPVAPRHNNHQRNYENNFEKNIKNRNDKYMPSGFGDYIKKVNDSKVYKEGLMRVKSARDLGLRRLNSSNVTFGPQNEQSSNDFRKMHIKCLHDRTRSDLFNLKSTKEFNKNNMFHFPNNFESKSYWTMRNDRKSGCNHESIKYLIYNPSVRANNLTKEEYFKNCGKKTPFAKSQVVCEFINQTRNYAKKENGQYLQFYNKYPGCFRKGKNVATSFADLLQTYKGICVPPHKQVKTLYEMDMIKKQ